LTHSFLTNMSPQTITNPDIHKWRGGSPSVSAGARSRTLMCHQTATLCIASHCTLQIFFPVSHCAINNVQPQNGFFNKGLRTRMSLIIKRPSNRIDEATAARGCIIYCRHFSTCFALPSTSRELKVLPWFLQQ